MGELLSKFELLDTTGQQELLDYLDFLIAKRRKKKAKTFDYEAYRKRILTIGTWSDEDMAPIEEARRLFNNWKPREWWFSFIRQHFPHLSRHFQTRMTPHVFKNTSPVFEQFHFDGRL